MKHIKKAAAILMAVVLSLCLAVTAFAEGTDSHFLAVILTAANCRPLMLLCKNC